MKQIVSNYSYSPTANCVTLTGLNIDQDQLLLVVAPGVGRTLYNFASVTGSVVSGENTRINLTASTAGLTTTSPLVIFYDDQSSTQTIAGTVTANTVLAPTQPIYESSESNADRCILIGTASYDGGQVFHTSPDNPLPISGTVTANFLAQDQWGTNPPESGNFIRSAIYYENSLGGEGEFTRVNNDLDGGLPIRTMAGQILEVAGTVTVGNSVTISSIPAVMLLGSNGDQIDNGAQIPISGNVGVDSLPPISGTVTANLSSVPTHGVTIANSSVTVNGTFYQATQPVSLVSVPTHGVTIAAGADQIGSVTVSAFPSGVLTTRFGSVTTANTAQLTTAVTNSARKYLLCQNLDPSTTVTIGIGFTPTTTQGIQLAAGGGIIMDSFVSTGAVWWLSSTTGSNFTILEG